MVDEKQAKRKAVLIQMAGIGEGKNRALFQRTRELARIFDLTVITAAHVVVTDDICQMASVYRVPRPKWLPGSVLFKLFYTIYLCLFLCRRKDIEVMYSFHRNGFTGAGIVKLLRRNGVAWFVDMQHTPFYYWDYAKHSYLSVGKRAFYRLQGLFYIGLGKLLLPRADRVFAMSFGYDEGFAGIMEKDFQVHRQSLSPIPNGVDISLIDDALRADSFLPDSFDPYSIHLVYAGNVRPERLNGLLSFRDKIEMSGCTAKLYICGRMGKAAREMVERIDGNQEKVEYLGLIPHDKLLQLYRTIDVCLVFIDDLMRDHQFSHPGKLFEAMAMGKLVLVSRLQSVCHYIVEDGQNAIVFDNDDMEGAVSRLLEVLADEALRKKIEKNARNSVERIDWHELNALWGEAVQETLKGKGLL